MEVTVVVHVQRPGSRSTLVEGDAYPDDILGFIKVVVDPAPLVVIRAVEAISLARPAGVGFAIVVPSVLGYAAVRAASITGRPVVIPSSIDSDGRPLASIDEGWSRNGVRQRGRGQDRRVDQVSSAIPRSSGMFESCQPFRHMSWLKNTILYI